MSCNVLIWKSNSFPSELHEFQVERMKRLKRFQISIFGVTSQAERLHWQSGGLFRHPEGWKWQSMPYSSTLQTLAHSRLEDWTITAKNAEVGKPACRSFYVLCHFIYSYCTYSFYHKLHRVAFNHRNYAKKRQNNTPTQEKQETLVIRKESTKNNKEQANQNKPSPNTKYTSTISYSKVLNILNYLYHAFNVWNLWSWQFPMSNITVAPERKNEQVLHLSLI